MKRVLLVLFAFLPFHAQAQDLRPTDPSVLYFVSIPLGAQSRAEREPVVGFALQGSRPYQAVRMDTRLMNLIGSGAIEAKWLIVGAVAAGTAVLAGSKDSSVETQRAQQEAAVAQAAANGGPTPCQVQASCFALRR
ncbi:MAG TPA: hypothetical protein VEB41_15000 [Burkholderiales bacterium]|nr:hypothetical protein [Burkholderiales bacterium]